MPPEPEGDSTTPLHLSDPPTEFIGFVQFLLDKLYQVLSSLTCHTRATPPDLTFWGKAPEEVKGYVLLDLPQLRHGSISSCTLHFHRFYPPHFYCMMTAQDMGFTATEAREALQFTNGDVEAAASYLAA